LLTGVAQDRPAAFARGVGVGDQAVHHHRCVQVSCATGTYEVAHHACVFARNVYRVVGGFGLPLQVQGFEGIVVQAMVGRALGPVPGEFGEARFDVEYFVSRVGVDVAADGGDALDDDLGGHGLHATFY
jgi:hypothetical protein